MPRSSFDVPSYRRVARVYDLLASGYSLGAIDRSKRVHHDLIVPGDRVLYVGAGRGKEIAGACERGAEVTCVEPCPSMALRLHDRLAEHGERFTIVPRPIQAIPVSEEYDLVVAHYFLNVFDRHTMPGILDRVCGFVRPGGRLVIADFMPSRRGEGAIGRAIRSAYYRPVNLAGRLLCIGALHAIYDYGPRLSERGYRIESRRSFAVLPGLIGYETITAMRPGEAHRARSPVCG
ncbi:MAG: class I SAM-dependent methyltransferase [Phycisphaeraceae bacterium]